MDNTLEIIKKIQEARSPKYFLYNIIKNLDVVEMSQRVRCFRYKKNDINYFDYEENGRILYYNFEYIYKVLYFKYNLNRGNQAHDLVKKMVNKHLHLKIDNISTYRP